MHGRRLPPKRVRSYKTYEYNHTDLVHLFTTNLNQCHSYVLSSLWSCKQVNYHVTPSTLVTNTTESSSSSVERFPQATLNGIKVKHGVGGRSEGSDTRGICVACLEHKASFVSKGCGHLVFCGGCRRKVAKRALVGEFVAKKEMTPAQLKRTVVPCPVCRSPAALVEISEYSGDLFVVEPYGS